MKLSSPGLCLMFLISACAPDDSNAAGEQELTDRDNVSMKNSRDASSRTPPIHVERRKERPLQRIDNLSVNELRKYLAGKQLEPDDLVFGRDSLKADGTWNAYREGIKATFQQGLWDVRPGSDGRPELCTTEIRRDGMKLLKPQKICRKIFVSLQENRAELEVAGYPSRKYEVTISKIEN